MTNDEPNVRYINVDTYAALFDPDGARKKVAFFLKAMLNVEDIPRLKDGWVEIGTFGQLEVVLYARPGADRECYCETVRSASEEIREDTCYFCRATLATANGHFSRMVYDTFDDGYAKFYYSVPDRLSEALRKLATPPVDTNEKWKNGLAALEHDPSPFIPPQLKEAIQEMVSPSDSSTPSPEEASPKPDQGHA